MNKGKKVSVETNGSVNIPHLSWVPLTQEAKEVIDRQLANLRFIVDYKLPSSGMEDKMLPNLFQKLRPVDVIKFVVKNNTMDLERMKELLEEHKEDWKAVKAISPCWGSNSSSYIAAYEYARLKLLTTMQLALQVVNEFSKYPNVTFSVQLHKILGLP